MTERDRDDGRTLGAALDRGELEPAAVLALAAGLLRAGRAVQALPAVDAGWVAVGAFLEGLPAGLTVGEVRRALTRPASSGVASDLARLRGVPVETKGA